MTDFSAKDSSIGLDLDLGSIIDKNTTVDGLAYYKNTMGRATPVSVLAGDVNDDLKVDLADAVSAARIISGLGSPQDLGPEADVNADGVIDAQEVIYILQRLSGLRQ